MRILTIVTLTFLAATANATEPRQDLTPERGQLFEKQPLEQKENYSQQEMLVIENSSTESTLEDTDTKILELLDASKPDISETGDWGWMADKSQLILTTLKSEDEKEYLPTKEKEADTPYDSLKITAEDKMIIGRLLMTMAENNVFKLLMERKRLERWGEQIGHVHPVRFLGTVFTDPRLTYCMREIRRSSFKWDGFVEGFSERMKEEAANNNLVKYVDGFAAAVQRDPEELYPYFERADFEGLVKYLLKN